MSPESEKRSFGGATASGSPASADWASVRSSSPAKSGGPARLEQAGEQPPVASTADLVDKAKETARSTAKAISSQVSELAGNIGSELTDTAEEQKGRGADAMRGFAKAVQGAANELDGQSPTVARYVRSAAQSVEGLSDSIRSRSVGDLITAATDTARTHPAAFFVGAVAVGFALSRFFKSSSNASVADAAPSAESHSDNSPPRGQVVIRQGIAEFGGRS